MRQSPQPIPRLHKPERAAFEAEWLKRDRPVILTGLLTDWPAREAWTDEALEARIGEREIPFWVSPDRIFGVAPFAELETETLPFREFMAYCRAGSREGGHLYLRKGALAAIAEELLADVSTPDYVDQRWLLSTNLWIGPAGHDTPLHYDLAHNLLAQVRGRKRIRLWAPETTRAMAPNPAFSNSPHFSRIRDLESVDPERFPGFAEAPCFEAELAPGEVLYLPICWWHQVLSLDFAISVNYWWAPPLDYLHPLVLRTAATPLHKAWLSARGRLRKPAGRPA